MRMLTRRGVGFAEAEDICQEVAWRVVDRGVPYNDALDLYRWAATAGWRLAIDLHRKGLRLAAVEPPDRPAPDDVAAVAESRSRLRAVVAAFPSLSAADQAALTDTGGGANLPRREAVRLAVRRHRARSRLLAMVEAAGAVIGVVAAVVGRAARRGRPRVASAVALTVSPALVLLISYGLGPEATGGPPSGSAVTADAAASRADGPAPPRVVVAPTTAPVAAAVPSAAPPPTSAPKAAPAVEAAAADAAVAVEPPVGPGAVAQVRDRRATDNDFCVSAVVGGTVCGDLPPLPAPQELLQPDR